MPPSSWPTTTTDEREEREAWIMLEAALAKSNTDHQKAVGGRALRAEMTVLSVPPVMPNEPPMGRHLT